MSKLSPKSVNNAEAQASARLGAAFLDWLFTCVPPVRTVADVIELNRAAAASAHIVRRSRRPPSPKIPRARRKLAVVDAEIIEETDAPAAGPVMDATRGKAN